MTDKESSFFLLAALTIAAVFFILFVRSIPQLNTDVQEPPQASMPELLSSGQLDVEKKGYTEPECSSFYGGQVVICMAYRTEEEEPK